LQEETLNTTQNQTVHPDLATVDVFYGCFTEEEVDVVVDVVRWHEVRLWTHAETTHVDPMTSDTTPITFTDCHPRSPFRPL